MQGLFVLLGLSLFGMLIATLFTAILALKRAKEGQESLRALRKQMDELTNRLSSTAGRALNLPNTYPAEHETPSVFQAPRATAPSEVQAIADDLPVSGPSSAP